MSQSALKLKDYKEDIHNDWCPGCGDFGGLAAIQMACMKLQLPPHEVAIVGGIGCSGKMPHYLSTYGFHTLHGRVVPSATGLKLANRSLTVIGAGGDGDAYGIGAQHFVAGGRRNLDFTYVVMNNDVYALTKGQASPTIEFGQKTKSMPEPSLMQAINPITLALASGYTFIARGYALSTKHLADLIARGIQHEGSALIDVLQTCPTYNDLHTKGWYAGKDRDNESRIYDMEEEDGYDGRVSDPSDAAEVAEKRAQALVKATVREPRIPLGVFYQIELPTFEGLLAEKMPALADKGAAEMDLYQRDISVLLDLHK